MSNQDHKVIGYFAFFSQSEIICSGAAGDACVISASVGDMKKFIMEINPDEQRQPTVKKTRFGEILKGLKLGAAYAFDEKAYKGFIFLLCS